MARRTDVRLRARSNELRTTKADLERAREHTKQYQAIAETQGESLREVTATYDEYKAATESSIAEKDVRPCPRRRRRRRHEFVLTLPPSSHAERDR